MQNKMAVIRAEDFQRKRQAVHLALSTVLTGEEVAGAIRSWEEQLANSTSLYSGLQVFARKVCLTYGKEGRHVELALAMSRALMSNDIAQASNDAVSGPASFKVEANDSAVLLLGPEVITPEFTSFQLLLQVYLRKVDERDAVLGRQCREFILNAVDNLPWSPEQQKQVINLIKKGSSRQVRPYRSGQLKSFMGYLILWMQEMFGEKVSRELTLQAIEVVEKDEAGGAYSPREFFEKL